MVEKSQDPAEQIFHDALDCDTPQRATFVQDACGDDDSLRYEVEALLAAHSDAPDYLEAHPPVLGSTLSVDQGDPWCDFSPHGNRLVTASRDKTARIWVRQGETWETDRVLMGQERRPLCYVEFSPDGKRIVTAEGMGKWWDGAGSRRRAQLWTGEGNLINEFLHQSGVMAASFSPDGRWLATAS